MKLLRNLLILLFIFGIAVIGSMFAIQNETPVPLDLLVYTFEPKTMALWVLSAFALGGVLGMLSCSLILVRMRASLGSHKRQLEKARGEMSKLRDAPPSLPSAQIQSSATQTAQSAQTVGAV